MSVASEIQRISNAKASLKTSINAKTDQQHQITNETIDEYADFVDSITSGGGGGGLDWSAIGYSGTPQGIVDGYNYAKNIYDNWTPNVNLRDKFNKDVELTIMPLVDTSIATTTYGMFNNCYALITIPLLNTSNVETMRNMFSSCYALNYVPILDTSSLTGTSSMQSMFSNCWSLTNTSLDNILQMCINATSYTGTKTLAKLGFTSSNYPTSRIQALPHYQDFINAGWTIGY